MLSSAMQAITDSSPAKSSSADSNTCASTLIVLRGLLLVPSCSLVLLLVLATPDLRFRKENTCLMLIPDFGDDAAIAAAVDRGGVTTEAPSSSETPMMLNSVPSLSLLIYRGGGVETLVGGDGVTLMGATGGRCLRGEGAVFVTVSPSRRRKKDRLWGIEVTCFGERNRSCCCCCCKTGGDSEVGGTRIDVGIFALEEIPTEEASPRCDPMPSEIPLKLAVDGGICNCVCESSGLDCGRVS